MENDARAEQPAETPPGVAYTIKIHQLANGHVQWENPTNDPAQLERILLQALAYIQRELSAVRTASLLMEALKPRIAVPNPGGLGPGGLQGGLRLR